MCEPIEQQFWMVWGGAPNKIPVARHPTEAAAITESYRLCEQTGSMYYVLRATSRVERPVPPIRMTRLEGSTSCSA